MVTASTPSTKAGHPPAGIRVVGIAKDFGGDAALRGVDLDIAPGELVALLGPSGSGKTTLLRIIAGLEDASAGQVFFGHDDATRLSVQERRVGFVFQHYALFRHMTVFDNVAYGLKVRPRAERPSKAEIRERVLSLIDLVQLGGLERRYPSQLSGGQRQRVALARALAVEPRVLLLDEPFGALDAKVRKDLRRWLREIHDRTGHTTVFVTHDQDEAMELADRVAILNKGRLEQVGSADEVYENPASAFVMSFVGDTVSLPVAVRAGRIFFGDAPLEADVADAPEGPAALYLRPSNLALTRCDEGGVLGGTVVAVRRTANGRRAEVLTDVGAASVEVELPSGKLLAPGERVGLHILKARLFPTA
ncbi:MULTISPECIES: sulfate ABC transporter ATP-binding protein [unclassified Chelatococcus]|uniref:sulfate/molybdate ABC transporter ATP-binding protein n=1 Tax=unclassified Chelatococcus TaxID=2638111 RepID=UPI001BCCAEDD|nr:MULTISPECIES: sulfate ABC transporter ATP-binding protein [unclassified Chelatococcus]CAH1660472.1 Sulfate/thiosulfate import ATP-binding protein CysA [Hyphomicrobiales bacterium]MBS7741114.1 sulfate ABC transporter ATP-binding protein [Chelatococcus sp. HY11]MBX3545300.1 sulfate ABC transporter ATP-binding protein [Chelatococcus sp.]MCO5077933.1 sulfate ABC transporter ATP-binding protein [Chelatococcus sp.]CAH1683422.1 Sulfate/thiosulfate import ATP-binding protein CysA [Hyphomicrobiales 